jgi:hypothetical protein
LHLLASELLQQEGKSGKGGGRISLLDGTTTQLTEEKFNNQYCFEISTTSKAYQLAASSRLEMYLWLR